MSTISKKEELGFGSFGKVYSAEKDNYEFALKRPFRYKKIDGPGGSFLVESDMLTNVKKNPFFVKALTVFSNPTFEGSNCLSPIDSKIYSHLKDDVYSLALEKAEMDFNKLLSTVPMTYIDLQRYMMHILLGIEYLHSQGVAHRDIKVNNLLFFKEMDPFGYMGTVKICDFGMAKYMNVNVEDTPNIMTSWFRAPEVALEQKKYTKAIDMWSVGCIFYQMIGRKFFIQGIEDDGPTIISHILGSLPYVIDRITYDSMIGPSYKLKRVANAKVRLSFAQQMDLQPHDIENMERSLGPGKFTEFCDLLLQLLQFNPEKRINIHDAINHPFFSNWISMIGKIRIRFPINTVRDRILSTAPLIERKWMMEIVSKIIRGSKGLRWFRYRTIFLAIDIFDRYISLAYKTMQKPINVQETETNGILHSKFEVQIYFSTIIYIAIKFFGSNQKPLAWKDILDKSFHTDDIFVHTRQFEMKLISDTLSYVIFKLNLFEYKNVNYSENEIKNMIQFLILHDDYDGEKLSSLYERYEKFCTCGVKIPRSGEINSTKFPFAFQDVQPITESRPPSEIEQSPPDNTIPNGAPIAEIPTQESINSSSQSNSYATHYDSSTTEIISSSQSTIPDQTFDNPYQSSEQVSQVSDSYSSYNRDGQILSYYYNYADRT